MPHAWGRGVLAFLIVTASTSEAAILKYDFTGTGSACQYTGIGHESICSENVAFTGLLTLDVFGSPSTIGSDVMGIGQTAGGKEWARLLFDIEWDGGTFHTSPVANHNDHFEFVSVSNNYDGLFDQIVLQYWSQRAARFDPELNNVDMVLYTGELDWLSDLSLNLDVGLPPQGFASLRFQHTTSVGDVNAGNQLGVFGVMTLDSLSRRVEVPEPGTLALLAAGFAGLALRRRRAA